MRKLIFYIVHAITPHSQNRCFTMVHTLLKTESLQSKGIGIKALWREESRDKSGNHQCECNATGRQLSFSLLPTSESTIFLTHKLSHLPMFVELIVAIRIRRKLETNTAETQMNIHLE